MGHQHHTNLALEEAIEQGLKLLYKHCRLWRCRERQPVVHHYPVHLVLCVCVCVCVCACVCVCVCVFIMMCVCVCV